MAVGTKSFPRFKHRPLIRPGSLRTVVRDQTKLEATASHMTIQHESPLTLLSRGPAAKSFCTKLASQNPSFVSAGIGALIPLWLARLFWCWLARLSARVFHMPPVYRLSAASIRTNQPTHAITIHMCSLQYGACAYSRPNPRFHELQSPSYMCPLRAFRDLSCPPLSQ